jgi:hypothetical protein
VPTRSCRPRRASSKRPSPTTSRCFISRRTLEWDLVAAGNWDLALGALKRIRPKVAERLTTELSGKSSAEQADAMLEAIVSVKGPFAQVIVAELRTGRELVVPPYLGNAIEWLTNSDGDGDEGATTPQSGASE